MLLGGLFRVCNEAADKYINRIKIGQIIVIIDKVIFIIYIMSAKLKEFKVLGLFGVFDHVITFNTEKGVTIVIGENGLGKTIMLEMINSFFNKEYYYWSDVLFSEAEIKFEDDEIWKITCKLDTKKRRFIHVQQIVKNGKGKNLTIPFEIDYRKMRSGSITHRLPFIERVGINKYVDHKRGEIIDRDTLYIRYSNMLDILCEDVFLAQEIKDAWFNVKIDKNKLHLINTQRILSIKKASTESTVKKHAEHLSEMIKKCLAKSTEESSKLDRTFPNRLLARIALNNNNKTDVLSRLNDLELKRKLLDKVGLIEISTDLTGITQEQLADSEVNNTLLLYIEDSFSKLAVFDDLSNKLDLFINIINKRFKHKTLHINKDSGFEFKSTLLEGSTIPLEKLSSGEQNELVLFFELLFESNNKTLVLIDEPEISLHISWQNCFIEDVKEITKINNIDVLIATHSPDIIADNWDLRVELKGLE